MREDILEDETGRWKKRSALVEETVADSDADREFVEERLDDLIEDGPVRSKEVGGEEYIALTSRSAALRSIAKFKALAAKERTKRRISGFVWGDDDE